MGGQNLLSAFFVGGRELFIGVKGSEGRKTGNRTNRWSTKKG